MTVEKTKTKKDKLSNETITKLNEYNPIDESIEINNDIITDAKIISIDSPDVSSILSEDIPTIELRLQHKKISSELTIDIIIDAFIDTDEFESGSEHYALLSELLLYFDLDIKSINELENKQLPIHIKRYNSDSYSAIPQINSVIDRHDRDIWKIDDIDIANHKYKDLFLMLKAQNYGKAKIVELIDNENSIKIGFEIPFCNSLQYINFSKNGKKDEISFNSLVEYILGQPPISEKEYSKILNKEVNVQYKNGFDIEKNTKNKLQKLNYTFLQFISHNKKSALNNFLYYTGLFALLYSLTPLAMIPIYLANSSNILIFSVIFLSLTITSLFTMSKLKENYNNL